jgi:hypothetical protein
MPANCDISDNKIREGPLLGNVAIPSPISVHEHRLISQPRGEKRWCGHDALRQRTRNNYYANEALFFSQNISGVKITHQELKALKSSTFSISPQCYGDKRLENTHFICKKGFSAF